MIALARAAERVRELSLSENARKVLESRYLRKNGEGKVVETPEELFQRVAATVAGAERAFGDISSSDLQRIDTLFYNLMAMGRFLPNSPTLMNAGREMGMLSACFVLPVDDSIDGIFDSIKHTALIQKAGGGTGFNFSRLRPRGDIVASSGGTTSGPLSFLKVFSQATEAIQQGAFRRGANMGVMRIDHPDIVSFIQAKEDTGRLTNYNLSVSITDAFMRKVIEAPDSPHVVVNPRTGASAHLPRKDRPGAVWTVGELFDLIVDHAWSTGEPGVLYIDRINRDNPTPHLGEIDATNPCGEQPLLPFEACNLGSINLSAFLVPEGRAHRIDFDALRDAIHGVVRFLDNVVEVNRYPLPQIEEMCRGNRKIGLGLMGFADALFLLGIPYGSDEGIAFGERIMKFLNDESHNASEALARERGVFPNWRGSVWDTRDGRPMRNAATTSIAPTGTISIIGGCSCGIEPLFSLVFFRNVLNGQRMIEANPHFLRVARERGFATETLLERIAATGSIGSFEEIPADVRRVFVTAHDIAPEWHIKMQAAFQKHCDASISKTTNFAGHATRDDVKKIYALAFEHGLKGVTVYRDGCRRNQPMALKNEKEARPSSRGNGTGAAPAAKAHAPLEPVAVPEIMPCLRIRQATPFGNMHIKISVEPDTGVEREVFAQLGRGGDVANSDLEAICRLLSLFLRCNGPLVLAIDQLDGIGSSLSIPSKDGRVMSLADGLAKALRKYHTLKDRHGLAALLLGKIPLDEMMRAREPIHAKPTNGTGAFKIKCPVDGCDSVLLFQEGCVKCPSCGFSQC
ncbi:MAG: vitamin B12-dependent ribonucleotide reductase [Planctomycetes bacterium]|nr:vitamin B12-dependent ribonucleotide reductase [Planctomycetota bacterium]